MAILTDARLAVWDAIDNWPALGGRFRQRLRFAPHATGKLTAQEADEPSGADFPCIAIAPSAINPVWLGNQIQFRPLSLTITIWTKGWNSIGESEELWEGVVDAIYKCKVPDDSDTYIGAATHAGPYGFGNSRWTRVKFENGTKAWSHSFDVVLKIISSLTV